MKNNYESKLSPKTHFNFPLPQERKLIVNFKRPKQLIKSCLCTADKRYFVQFIYKCQKCTPLQLCLCLRAIVYYFSYFWRKQSKQTCSFFLANPETKRETNVLMTIYWLLCEHAPRIVCVENKLNTFSVLFLEMKHLWSHQDLRRPWRCYSHGGTSGRIPTLAVSYLRLLPVMMQQEAPPQILVHAFRHLKTSYLWA